MGGGGGGRHDKVKVKLASYLIKEGVGPPFHPFFLPRRGRGISGLVNTGRLGTLKKKKKDPPPSFIGGELRLLGQAADREVN